MDATFHNPNWSSIWSVSCNWFASVNNGSLIGVYMSKFYIRDWAGNIVNHVGVIQSSEYGVAMEFSCFEAGEEYLVTLLGSNYVAYRETFFVVPID